MANNPANTRLKVALGIAIALFIGTAVYTSSLYQDKQEKEQQLTSEKNDVLENLNAMKAKYDLALSESEVTNQNLVEARERIQGLIDSLKTSETNVKSLWRYKQKYLALQEEMDVLLAENDRLKVENMQLATTLDSTKVQLEEGRMFNDSLVIQNTALAEVMENAAVLTTANLKGFGVIERSNGKLIPTERARRSDKIRVCYTVAKNKLVQSGDKELYVQVIDPKNNILGLNQQVSFGDQSLNYSVISKFNYENKNLDVCEFVKNNTGEDFEKGRYKVNVFNGKELVSNSEFTLK
ncbi:chromosome partitioning protein ParA [Mesoflavibacter profundi]|uniref:Chromosome partitioning protein ParA n=1 Tax=Mesoflavibacter profundi TaxID=2708110 RepID=A0ABT4RY18_9FLAO|nr:chromosome partitioning protein ParA [Mesoflavibacter profundi]MDA0176719.1 chromosome partitioning protein ParA [Mesoflavibacter profundi]